MTSLIKALEVEMLKSLENIDIADNEITSEIVRDWYFEAEKIIRVTANLALDESSHQAINQLRYAGHHLLKANTISDQQKSQSNLVEAYKHSKRAYYDVLDFFVLILLDRFEEIAYNLDNAKEKALHDAFKKTLESIQNARFNNESRADYYKFIQSALIDGLGYIDQCNQLQLTNKEKYIKLQEENKRLTEKSDEVEFKLNKIIWTSEKLTILFIAVTTMLGLALQGSLTDYWRDPITKIEHSLNLEKTPTYPIGKK